MLVVISAAKALDCSVAKTRTHTQAQFLKESSSLVRILRKKSRGELKSLMGVSDAIAKLNYERYQQWGTPFTLTNAKQAILTFKGDAYKSLEVESLDANDLKFAQKHLYILSGLYGLLRVLDLIQPYRLDMGTRLSNGQWRNLYQFWGNKLSAQINAALQASSPSAQLINLASGEYSKAIQLNTIEAPVITPVFKEKRGDAYKTIGFVAKKARGLMSRYVIKNRIKSAEQLQQFRVDGYRFRPRMSDDSTWVFTRG